MALQSINSFEVIGEEIHHFTHPQHALTLMSLPYLFTCHGCKEYGAGARYRCNDCNIDIHEFCAKAPPSISHPYHTQHQLVFYNKLATGSGFVKSKCDICGHSFKGFAFRCNACHFNLHPCCAELPRELNYYGHPQHTLKLLSGSPSAEGSSYTCGACGKKGSSWVYYCPECDYYLDTVCAKTAINGLHAQGIVVPTRQKKLKTAARFATQVVQLFVDGLVEGLGEGLADVILDNGTRGFNGHGGGNNTDHGDNGH